MLGIQAEPKRYILFGKEDWQLRQALEAAVVPSGTGALVQSVWTHLLRRVESSMASTRQEENAVQFLNWRRSIASALRTLALA